MERKSIGSFIAALRRANGLTQQELADKLNVSNKAVSRWERDETLPDLTLIPAIAEIFGVTCDEILRGERKALPETAAVGGTDPEDIETDARAEARAAQKSERRAAAIVDRALSRFKTSAVISFALALVGVLAMFLVGMFYQGGITVIGLVVMLIFDVAAVTVTVISMMRLREACGDELTYCSAEVTLRCERTKVNWSFAVFAAVALSVWFLIVVPSMSISVTTKVSTSFESFAVSTEDGVSDIDTGNSSPQSSVIHGADIVEILAVFVCPAAVLYLMYDPYARLITGKGLIVRNEDTGLRRFRIISAALGSVSVLAALANEILRTFFNTETNYIVRGILQHDIVVWISMIFFFAVIAAGIAFVALRGERRLSAVAEGVKASLFTLGTLFIATSLHSVSFDHGAKYLYYDGHDVMLGIVIIIASAAAYRMAMKRIREK